MAYCQHDEFLERANELCGFVSPYYPACAHLRRRIDGELLPQVRTASDMSWKVKP
jgi:hypothetical protein